MLKLFKYNWKKGETVFYSSLGVIAILFVLLYVATHLYDWQGEFVIFLGALSIASAVLQILYILVIYNINASMKNIGRRLLPVKPVHEYLAYLAIPTIYSTIIGTVFWIFFLVMKNTIYYTEVQDFVNQFNNVTATISIVLMLIVYSVFNNIMSIFAITIARLSRSNLRILIFIGVLFGVSIIYGILNATFNRHESMVHPGWITFEVYERLNELVFDINFFSFNWFLFVELGFALILAYITVYLIKNKIEVH